MLELPPIELKPGFTHYFHGIDGAGIALTLAEMAKQSKSLVVVLLDDASEVLPLSNEIAFFLGETSDLSVISFPDWETLPYDYFSPHEDIISERIKTLYELPRLTQGILLLPISSALQMLPDRKYIELHSLSLSLGQTLELQALRLLLDNNGYHSVSKVMNHGEYAARGSIIDIFPVGVDDPIRIELFDNEIESLRYFDSETQLSKYKIEHIKLLPAREYPTNDDAISRFRRSWRNQFNSDIKNAPLYQSVSQGIFPAGIEYYLPLFFQKMSTIFDYLPIQSLIVESFVKNIATTQAQEEAPPRAKQAGESSFIKHFWQQLMERYEQYRHDLARPIVTPENLYLREDLFNQLKNNFALAAISHVPLAQKSVDLKMRSCPEVKVNHRADQPLLNFKQASTKFDQVLICAESTGRQEVIRELLSKNQIKSQNISSWAEYLDTRFAINQQQPQIFLAQQPNRYGFALADRLVVCESDLFGQQVIQSRTSGNKVLTPDQLIHSLAELKIGDAIVHVDQGVGRYLGLQTIEVGELATEFLTLEYRGGSKLYVPVQSLHLIHRYSGSNPETAPWHKLGAESWSKAKKKALDKARDTAAELLEIYARRGAQIGIKHSFDALDYEKFANDFPFELTQDQSVAIKAVIKDMTTSQPMDRLVCGDVGFGKTEVAMRAAFICAQSGMQTAILVPTTLLAQQHFHSFQDRFSEWPINIAVLSRFQTKKEQTETLIKLKQGTIDLVVGTHRLISTKLEFKQLGLLIIDEEHRFGVRQKEQLKSYRAQVDILTLTATPIPRTLNMSMSGMRDLSIIATPPAKRLAIKTFVRERNLPLIKEAIHREIRRGGQIYFLHNAVESIEKTATELRQLIPEISIAVAHGQMRERQLEDIMDQFYHQRYQMLVCTTIIETGLDIPTANTIIMDRADKLGLAQLHQLRGRVGRSHHQAYAYLLTPPSKNITKDAKKRLEAIEKLEDLGAGFILASHDLEIRGAGELLGDEQSGHMQTIGFSLYMELLEKAILSLETDKNGEVEAPTVNDCEVNLGLSALLPDDYIYDVSVRLTLYKRIASATNSQALRELQVELIDRFGLLPNAAKNLFTASEIRNSLAPLGVVKVDVSDLRFSLEFNSQPNIDTQNLILLIQQQPDRYRLIKGSKLEVSLIAEDLEQRQQQIETLIERLSA